MDQVNDKDTKALEEEFDTFQEVYSLAEQDVIRLALKWLIITPTQEGYYWCKFPYRFLSSSAPSETVAIVDVYTDDGGNLAFQYKDGYYDIEIGEQWAGPILEPK